MNRFTRIATILSIPLLSAALFAGCSPGGEGADDEVGGATEELEEGTASGDPTASGDTGCVAGRTWRLDIPDLASQLAIELATTGFSVVEYAGIGEHTLVFDEAGAASADVDMTMSVTVNTDAGIMITVVQVHVGAPSGQWGWVGDTSTMEFASWNDGGYTVENFMTINGVSSESTIPIPSDPLTGSKMAVECSGSTLTTTTAGSPYIQRWTTDD